MNDFEMPTLITPKHRTSSITNAFTNGIMPQINPSKDEIEHVLSLFNQQRGRELKCVYCDEPATEWDHFHPLIKDKLPTGYITEIYNLVPCCHTCNGSKGAKEWKDYLESKSKKSARIRLTSRNLNHLIEPTGRLYRNLEKFEKYSNNHIHHIKFIYDAKKNIQSIIVNENSKSTQANEIVNKIINYYSKLKEINNALVSVADTGNEIRERLGEILA